MPLLSDAAHRIAVLDSVDLWLCHLDEVAADVDRYTSILQAEEMARAGCFHFARDRNRFIGGRASTINRPVAGNSTRWNPSPATSPRWS
jgi:hypothetical protein